VSEVVHATAESPRNTGIMFSGIFVLPHMLAASENAVLFGNFL
jgi:hypothetical protein